MFSINYFSAIAGLLSVSQVRAIYLPGMAPVSYKVGDEVSLTVNALNPDVDRNDPQLKSILSYDYYYPQFHFCQPEGGPKAISENLGSVLFGDRIYNSPYKIQMMQDLTCGKVCTTTIPGDDAKFINAKILLHYSQRWAIDQLPAAQVSYDESNNLYYNVGFDLGLDKPGERPILYNHHKITIEYHPVGPDEYRVVGVLVEAMSRKEAGCSGNSPVALKEDEDNVDIPFTYDVTWKLSDTAWATRWDKYLHVLDPKIHWFSLINSAVIVIFLASMVVMVLMKALHRDITRYNRIDLDDDVQEDSGWKLIHGDVFRPPNRSLALSVFLGSGSQLFCMVAVIIGIKFSSHSLKDSIRTVWISVT
ncbi:Transmembrane 9 superfamily member 1 [Neolecta irregularis DAH-3]|uniref:Transmembrane 9 superfamily member n=1 Tax=Neolecta irregularis (strain DAH-3) TaxID=1198029 RepID=A0A1U7LJP7_NEOID|nr:Transmembrane 9 superfamily member 1 [Neolecta irregularis DAH-3]|eukprot:OLL22880.1 Transmembrane 9 superfamily member 1 [Neolecta irregularis DAH-3]